MTTRAWTIVWFAMVIVLLAGADRGWSRPWLLALAVALVAVWDVLRRRRRQRS